MLDMDIQSGGFRDGLTQAFTLVLFTEIADKTFFVACIMGLFRVSKFVTRLECVMELALRRQYRLERDP
jgi:hypothetical protein